jgi:hypothetical protein
MVSDIFKALAGFAGLSDKIARMVQDAKLKKAGRDELLLKQAMEEQAAVNLLKGADKASRIKERREELYQKYKEKQ